MTEKFVKILKINESIKKFSKITLIKHINY